MKDKKTKIIIGIILIPVTVLIFFTVQSLLMPKYQKGVIEGSFTGEYYRDKAPHEVLIFGDCDAYENINPIKMYQDYGISSYIRGSGEQYIFQSYYLLEDALRYETPKVVILSVHSLQFDHARNESYNRMTLDGMRWSSSKTDAVKASMMEGETFLSYVFPILRYHDRWSELTAADLEHIFSKDITSHNGYYMRCDTVPFTGFPPQTPLIDPSFGDNAMYYLDKIYELCESNGIELILYRAPIDFGWYDQWDENVEEYAASHGLIYLNLCDYKEQMGLDMSVDTYDGGIHLNLNGANKASSFLGSYLTAHYDLTDFRNDPEVSAIYDEKIEFYDFMREDQMREIEQYGQLISYGANAIEQ